MIYNCNTNTDIEMAFSNNEILDVHSSNTVVTKGII